MIRNPIFSISPDEQVDRCVAFKAPAGHETWMASMGDGDPTATEVLDLVERLGGLLIAGGYEGMLGVQDCLRAVATAYGRSARVALTAESAVVEIGGKTRVVTRPPEIPQLDQVSAFKPWLAEVTTGRVPLDEARRRLDRIASMPMPYRPWLRVLGVVLFSVGFGISIQPTLQEIIVTALLGLVVGLIYVKAQESERPSWLAPLAASVLVGMAVLTAARHGWVTGGTVQLMIPVLFVFIPGDALTMSMVELAAGRITAGAARLLQSLTALGALAFGPVLAAAMLGVEQSEIFDRHVAPTLGPWAGWFGWSLFTVGVLLIFGMRAADLPWVWGMVMGTYAVQLLVVHVLAEVAGTFVTALIMAASCMLIGARPRTPPAYVLYLAPFFILTPGAHGLTGLEVWLGGTVDGVQDLTGMFILIAAIALGVLTATALLPRTTLFASSFHPAAPPEPR